MRTTDRAGDSAVTQGIGELVRSKGFIGLVIAACLCTGCSGLLDGCPKDAVEHQRQGLAAVKDDLAPGAMTKQILNECDSGDGPWYTVYVKGKADPVQELLAKDPAWIIDKREASDPEQTGTEAHRPFNGLVLYVSSRSYTKEFQKEQPEPGVNWFMSIDVR
jgi:hypothetical protein